MRTGKQLRKSPTGSILLCSLILGVVGGLPVRSANPIDSQPGTALEQVEPWLSQEKKSAREKDPNSPQAQLKRAAQLVKSDHVVAAKPILNKLLKQDPRNVKALRLLAECHINENLEGTGHKRARQLLQRAIRIDPDYSDSYRLLADIELIDGNYKQALTLCDRALACTKPANIAHRTKSIALTNVKRPKEAVKEMELFLEGMKKVGKKPPTRTVEVYAGTLEEAGMYKEAIAVYSQMQKESYSDHMALKVAQCYQKMAKPEEAVRTLDQLIKANDQDELALAERARIFVSMGKLKEALRDYSKSLELAPMSKSYLERAAVYEKLGMKDKANSDRQKAAAF
ncbi:MAG TPA: tetratricopeptide repeat protein [Candidatus Obscuribacter sp.]|mgnify:FL=1|nr:tetratricopeptide repeat protein [Candidatus Obscuribacter sp.]HMX47218.1 tetratricopeptide repeat protein [Candidatus Obscuribacter sp.]HMY03009.1 tetratricopeptide repeat protein [Candidatus Obscuribacter sp.]HMY55498.1 tetratricopeptide repeat protein [Candidatus Obscuribacter sp.]HNB14109.1 tetratricopeptide repeat protein [Candidatus Obscuribacter sp.]